MDAPRRIDTGHRRCARLRRSRRLLSENSASQFFRCSASGGEHCEQPFAFRKQPESSILFPTIRPSSCSWSVPTQFAFQLCSNLWADHPITPTDPSNTSMLTPAIIASAIFRVACAANPPQESRDIQWCSSERSGWDGRECAANGCSQLHGKDVGNELLRVGACWPPQVSGLCFSSHGWSLLSVRSLV